MTAPLAVVTGGTRGIGLAFSRRLLDLGHRVVAMYRCDDDGARQARDKLGERFTAVRADVADPDAVRARAAEVLAGHGTPEVLVNNAGRNIDGPFLTMTDDAWAQVVAVNLSGVFHVTRAFAPAMVEAGRGRIVNIGATTGIRPRTGGVNYCASKAGLLQLTKCLALELAPAVRVNCLIPGMTRTDELVERFDLDDPASRDRVLAEIPQRRIGDVEDIAGALEFLIGPASSYMTGQKLIVDGGQFMW